METAVPNATNPQSDDCRRQDKTKVPCARLKTPTAVRNVFNVIGRVQS